MTDITDIVHGLADAPARWSQERGAQVAQAFSRHLGLTVSWDEDAGEDWARVIDDRRVRVFVGIRWPVVMVLEPDLSRLQALIPDDVACLVVTDMDERELSASEDSLFAAFGQRAHSAALTPGAFSATDLWFATV